VAPQLRQRGDVEALWVAKIRLNDFVHRLTLLEGRENARCSRQ
jgi:hypothetical protein